MDADWTLQPINLERAPSNELTTGWSSNPYIKAATSQNTRKAYQSDVRQYEAWGGRLPATPELIVLYLQAFATLLNARTLARRLTALKYWHTYQGFPDPTDHPAIQKTLAGIIRAHGKPKEKAYPLLPDDLLHISQYLCSENTLAAKRDMALLQVGFFGAFRRSELVNIHVQHLDWKEQGIDILIPHSKTDTTHEGQYSAIPYGKGILCPVTALKNWLEAAEIQTGPIFREIKKNNHLQQDALAALSINLILKKRARQCGLPFAEQLSSHSLRRGLATSASMAGANLVSIMRQGRWKQTNTVIEYIEASERFNENASLKILQNVTIAEEKK